MCPDHHLEGPISAETLRTTSGKPALCRAKLGGMLWQRQRTSRHHLAEGIGSGIGVA